MSGVDEARRLQIERSVRLKAAVKAAGGNRVVASHVGMPVGTLNRYLAGRDMKASAMISLAASCNVSLEWMATGREAAPKASATPDTVSQADIDFIRQFSAAALQFVRGVRSLNTALLTLDC